MWRLILFRVWCLLVFATWIILTYSNSCLKKMHVKKNCIWTNTVSEQTSMLLRHLNATQLASCILKEEDKMFWRIFFYFYLHTKMSQHICNVHRVCQCTYLEIRCKHLYEIKKIHFYPPLKTEGLTQSGDNMVMALTYYNNQWGFWRTIKGQIYMTL